VRIAIFWQKIAISFTAAQGSARLCHVSTTLLNLLPNWNIYDRYREVLLREIATAKCFCVRSLQRSAFAWETRFAHQTAESCNDTGP